MKYSKLSILLILYLLNTEWAVESDEIFIEYGMGNEGAFLSKLFYGVNDGFYVDIGSYDAVGFSNTLNLYSMGWKGINVDASPKRLSKFFITRPNEINLNLAIGEQNKFVTLYEFQVDSGATISQKVKNDKLNRSNLMESVIVPAITMKQLCERYYYQKPTLINLDIEGYGARALMTNDWNNSRCVADVIISENNQYMKASQFISTDGILSEAGYKKWPIKYGLNDIHIHKSVYEKYEKKFKQSEILYKNRKQMSIIDISDTIASSLKVYTTLVPHYDPTIDNIYWYFAQERQIVNIDRINEYSNQISEKKDRPIVICHFNVSNSVAIFHSKNYSVSRIVMNNIYFYNVTVLKKDNKFYTCFILNHQIGGQKQAKIYSIDDKQIKIVKITKQINNNKIKEKHKLTQQQQQKNKIVYGIKNLQLLNKFDLQQNKIYNKNIDFDLILSQKLMNISNLRILQQVIQFIQQQQTIFLSNYHQQNQYNVQNSNFAILMTRLQFIIFIIVIFFSILNAMLLYYRNKQNNGLYHSIKQGSNIGYQSVEKTSNVQSSQRE